MALLMRLLLLCVWCSMASYTVITAGAQTLTITKASPMDDVVEGDTVALRCDAYNLQPTHYIEWVRLVMSSYLLLATNGTRTSLDPRFTLNITRSSSQARSESLIISDVQKEDATTYSCLLRVSEDITNVMTHSIYLPVLYFPSDMYPICIPNGPFTVQEGTTVNMSCTTEIGNPPVTMQILTNSTIYVWTFITVGNKQMGSLNLSVNEDNQGFSYECKITSTRFQSMERSCTMGPITTTTQSITTQPTTLHSETTLARIPESTTPLETIISRQPTEIPPCKDCSLNIPLLAAFIIILILFIVSLIINIFLLIKHRHLKITKEKETNVAKADPYMELQPTEDKNKVYMEPTTATTTTQDTYYQPVEVETDSHEYDYARPEGSTNTDYEAVSKPQSSAERPYQNMKQY